MLVNDCEVRSDVEKKVRKIQIGIEGAVKEELKKRNRKSEEAQNKRIGKKN